tara:strand:+ start:973 stop:1098 length:126 start_codon:yes stop_codon:yes gene_type:complete
MENGDDEDDLGGISFGTNKAMKARPPPGAIETRAGRTLPCG